MVTFSWFLSPSCACNMADSADGIFSSFWSSAIWLPPNVTWEIIEQQKVVNVNNNASENYAEFSDLLYSIPIALVMMLTRLMIEKVIFWPLGLRFGLKDIKKSPPLVNHVLEEAFRKSAVVKPDQLKSICMGSGLTEIQVERWFRQKRLTSLPSKLKKFSETGWRWFFYTSILLYGFICLWDKPWFWDVRNCWYGYPDHKVSAGVWYYYMVELSFYMSLSISQFFDVKRKDFWEMFIHHTTTIALIMFSWTTHFIRIGTLVLLLHDCGDPFLELAKMLRYLNYRKSCDAFIVIFAIIWVVTRCIIFPSWILKSTLYDAAKDIEMFPAYYIFNGLLVTLQVLHIIWTYFLFKAVYKAITSGQVEDELSEGEPSDDEDENRNDTKRVK